MSAAATSAAVGFLTVVEDDEFGLCGGYLLLSVTGRPLEFHCTAPVRASRAQEILYGRALRGYLFELIGPALLQKAKLTPALVCIEATVAVRERLLAYFGAHGYERLDKYLVHDAINWYFAPKAAAEGR